jgi:hypothetical protein
MTVVRVEMIVARVVTTVAHVEMTVVRVEMIAVRVVMIAVLAETTVVRVAMIVALAEMIDEATRVDPVTARDAAAQVILAGTTEVRE